MSVAATAFRCTHTNNIKIICPGYVQFTHLNCNVNITATVCAHDIFLQMKKKHDTHKRETHKKFSENEYEQLDSMIFTRFQKEIDNNE